MGEIPKWKGAPPIRVLFITPGLQTGGAEVMLQKILLFMDRSRFEPVVLSLSAGGAVGLLLEAMSIPVHCMNWTPGKIPFSGYFELLRKLRQIKPGIVQGWMYHGNLTALVAAKASFVTAPVVWGIRGTHVDLDKEKILTAFVIWLGAKLSGCPDKVIYNSQRSKDQHEERLGYGSNKGVVIPNGFDTKKFVPIHAGREKLRATLGLPENFKLVGLFARNHPMKNHGVFVRAAALLCEKRQDLAFVMAGDGIDGNNEALTKKIGERKLDGVFFLMGPRSDMERVISVMDVVCSTSDYGEAFPNVIGEAMSCGIPCVVTDVGDSAYIAGDAGCVVTPGDVDGLASAIDGLLNLTAHDRSILGESARLRVIENFEIRTIVEKYERLYVELLD